MPHRDPERAGHLPLSLDTLTKMTAATIGLFYVTGLLAVNADLNFYGVTDFDLLRARYIYTGALVFGYLIVAFFMAVIAMPLLKGIEAGRGNELKHKWMTKLFRRIRPANRFLGLVAWVLVPYLLLLFFLRL